MSLTTEDIRELLAQPEGSRLEFRSGRNIVKNAANMAPLVAGFANSEGGVLLIGHDEERRAGQRSATNLGVEDVDAALRGIQQMLAAVSPQPEADVTVHDIGGKKLVAVEVAPGADVPYLGAGSAVRRVGARLEPLTADELRRHATATGQVEVHDMLERLLEAVNEQSSLIVRLREQLAQATSAKRQWQYGLIFVALGAAVSIAIAVAG